MPKNRKKSKDETTVIYAETLDDNFFDEEKNGQLIFIIAKTFTMYILTILSEFIPSPILLCSTSVAKDFMLYFSSIKTIMLQINWLINENNVFFLSENWANMTKKSIWRDDETPDTRNNVHVQVHEEWYSSCRSTKRYLNTTLVSTALALGGGYS